MQTKQDRQSEDRVLRSNDDSTRGTRLFESTWTRSTETRRWFVATISTFKPLKPDVTKRAKRELQRTVYDRRLKSTEDHGDSR